MSSFNLFDHKLKVAGALLTIWLGPPVVARCWTGSWDSAGHVGDAFSIANSLISSLALVGVILTLLHQHSESKRRDAESLQEQGALKAQILQLTLSTRLQVCRALITEHRQAIAELNPSIPSVPTATKLLHQLRERVERESAANAATRRNAQEVVALINELLALQDEILQIRASLTDLQPTPDPAKPK